MLKIFCFLVFSSSFISFSQKNNKIEISMHEYNRMLKNEEKLVDTILNYYVNLKIKNSDIKFSNRAQKTACLLGELNQSYHENGIIKILSKNCNPSIKELKIAFEYAESKEMSVILDDFSTFLDTYSGKIPLAKITEIQNPNSEFYDEKSAIELDIIELRFMDYYPLLASIDYFSFIKKHKDDLIEKVIYDTIREYDFEHKLVSEYSLKNGKFHGTSKIWYSDSMLMLSKYKKGVLINKKHFSKDSLLSLEKYHRIFTRTKKWHANGKIKQVSYNFKRRNYYKNWDDAGKLIAKEKYIGSENMKVATLISENDSINFSNNQTTYTYNGKEVFLKDKIYVYKSGKRVKFNYHFKKKLFENGKKSEVLRRKKNKDTIRKIKCRRSGEK